MWRVKWTEAKGSEERLHKWLSGAGGDERGLDQGGDRRGKGGRMDGREQGPWLVSTSSYLSEIGTIKPILR